MCSCQFEDQAKDVLDEAPRLAREGKYEEALRKHIWFHDNALNVTPSYYRVRLSYALRDWVALGKKYPKALDALKDIRDAKTTRLLGNEFEKDLFMDVKAINFYLKEQRATVELFKEIGDANYSFAVSVYDWVDDALIEAREFALARKYLGDPIKRLATASLHYEKGVRYIETSQDNNLKSEVYAPLFVDRVVRLITVLKEAGDMADAQKIQARALKVVDSTVIRDAFDEKK